IPGVALAARYVPATADMEVGGDWYDVVPLPDGHLGLAIGDVAGHGLRAASTMGQLRMALRAYAVEEESPAQVVSRAHQLVERMGLPDIATLVYLVFDPDSGAVRYTSAGHPPPLIVGLEGEASYLEGGLAPPLRAVAHPDFSEACANVIQHAYGGGEGHIEVDLAMVDGDVEVTVRDTGRWRSISPHGGGRGLDLMRGLMDTVEVDTGPDGTVVRMRRRVRKEAD